MIVLVEGFLFAQSNPAKIDRSKPVVATKPDTSYLLRYQFQKGQSLHYKSITQMTMLTVKGEHQEKMLNRTETKKHFKVIDAKQDGSATLGPIIDHVKMFAKFNDEKPNSYDSSSKSEPPRQYKHVVESIGIPMVHLNVSKRGHIIDVIPQKRKKKPAVIVLIQGNRADQIAQKNFLIKFPNKALEIGDSWAEILHSSVSNPKSRLQTPVKLKRAYRLKAVKNGVATISVKTYLLTNIRDPKQRVQLISRTPRGTIMFDIKRGILLSRKTETDKKVFGVSGDDSYMKATSSFEEEFVENK